MHVSEMTAWLSKTVVCFVSYHRTLFPIQGHWEGGREGGRKGLATGSGQGCESIDVYAIPFYQHFPILVFEISPMLQVDLSYIIKLYQ